MNVLIDDRVVLGADGIGCLGAGLALFSDRLSSALGLRGPWRGGAALGLAATSLTLLTAAARRPVRKADLRRAATVNLGWTLVCGVGAVRCRTALGSSVLAATAVFDAAAAVLQAAAAGGGGGRRGERTRPRFAAVWPGRESSVGS